MSKIKYPEYAFPIPPTTHPGGQVEYGTTGMTMRQYYAGQALQGILMAVSGPEYSYAAKLAIEYADALIEELSREN